MTAVDERGIAKFFEEFEPPEGIKAELLRGEIVMGENADYQRQQITKFGAPLPLEDLELELDTSEFGIYPSIRPHRYP
ncbi:hypothetical protein OG331_32835 [Streptomyces sp. NBC_01017]|uniref:hypothetical protein n=1 Tax=Streptomyces sp. NBC_01017 TaxID=2903721 RepID=UPI00386D103B|nr:hypothetical protein OG331_32835 [Streptomyces sp. NBC_01017]